MPTKNKNYVQVLVKHIEKEPWTELIHEEFDTCYRLFGSHVSMLRNRHLNQINLLLELLQDSELQQDFCKFTSTEDFKVAIFQILTYNPQLTNSKVVKQALKQWKIRDNRKRKKHIQYLSRY